MSLSDLTEKQLEEIKKRDENKRIEQRQEEILEAMEVLIEACNIGQRHGAYSLQESRHIINAIDKINSKSKSYKV